jgi:23S rRNA (pseudouridine1915-N3)-methyltransferase
VAPRHAALDITIAAVGRLRRGPELDLIDDYRKRLSWAVTIREIEEKRPLPTPERRAREGERLFDALPEGALLIALDERGRQFSSEEFAGQLRKWQESGHRTLAFAIGGADGLDQAVTDRATLLLALGRMTWPHMMARCMLVEQLYRAQQIQAGHPYHKG